MAARRGPGCGRRGRRTAGGRSGLWLVALAALFAAVAPKAAASRTPKSPSSSPTAWVTQTGGYCTSPDRKCITFVSALTEPCYNRIQLLSNITLTAADFEAYERAPYLLERDLAIVGEPGRFPQIDFNFLTTRVIMAKGVTVRFDSLRLTNPKMSAGLGIDLFGGRDGSAIIIRNADRFRFASLDAMEVCSVAEGYPRPKRFPGTEQKIEESEALEALEEGMEDGDDGLEHMAGVLGGMTLDEYVIAHSCNATHPVDVTFVDVAFRVNATTAGAAFGDEGYDMAIVNMTRSCHQVIPPSCFKAKSGDKCLYEYTMAHMSTNKAKGAGPAGAAGGLTPRAIAGVAISGAAGLLLLAFAMLAVGRWRGGALERRKAGSLDATRFPHSGPLEDQLRAEQGWALTSFMVAPDLPGNASAQDKIEFGPMLGRGSFGTVYRGVWQGLAVAIKVVQHSGRQMCDNILSEAKLLLSLDHPNVIKAYTVTQWKNTRPTEPNDSAMDQNEVRDFSPKSTPNPTSGAATTKGATWSFVKSAQRCQFGGGCEAPGDLESGGRQGQVGLPARPTPLSVGFSSWAMSAEPRELSSDGGSVNQGAETWLITEYCSGGSLQQAASAHQLLNGVDGSPNQVTILCILRDVACGLAYLHDKNVCHADLKADNVLLMYNPLSRCGLIAKLGDFGLSRSLGANQTHASTRTFGTVTHMPPELLTTGKLSARGDVYALGILIWEAWTATAAFSGMSFPEVFAAVTVQKARPPVPADMPAPLAGLMCSCWAQDPTERPDAVEIVAALDDMLAGLGNGGGRKCSGV